MFFKRIKTPGIAHNAYLIGNKGEAAVIDPRRDIDEYLRLAAENKLTIKYVLETHRQEDFVLGSSTLAKVTGAKIVNGNHELFGHGDIRLDDGEDFKFADFRFQAIHTPGHTPEGLCYAVYIPDSKDKAWAIFTGDTLFIGETGRTDLPDRKKTAENAAKLYDSIHQKLIPLGDQAIIYPAHGSGSVCGGNIAERDESTLGMERVYNAVFTKARKDFIDSKIQERIPRPPYFRHMEKVNSDGGIPLKIRPNEVKILQPKAFDTESKTGIIIDCREPEAFAGGHIGGSLSIWKKGLSVFGGWYADHNTSIYLVLSSMSDMEEATIALARIGLDGVEGVLAGGFDSWRDAGLPISCSGTTTVRELSEKLNDFQVLDVRDDMEFETEGHIPDASHLYVGYMKDHLRDLKPPLNKSQAIAVTCSVGHRASLATSVLQRNGFSNVNNLLGGMTAWEKLNLPKEKGSKNSTTTTDIEGARL